jgi:hypothetical protein
MHVRDSETIEAVCRKSKGYQYRMSVTNNVVFRFMWSGLAKEARSSEWRQVSKS